MDGRCRDGSSVEHVLALPLSQRRHAQSLELAVFRAGRLDDAAGDLAAVGNQNLLKHVRNVWTGASPATLPVADTKRRAVRA